jgi:hypothetical protein
LIGKSVDVPPALTAMLQRPAVAEPMVAEDGALREWLLEKAALAS